MMTNLLPKSLYTVAEVRELDRLAIEEWSIPSMTLMQRAGHSLYALIERHWPQGPITIFCGAGNNAGDGYVVAALAAEHQRQVTVIQVAATDRLTGDALKAYQRALELQVPMFEPDKVNVTEGLIVDALLGTGLTGEVRAPYRKVIQWINDSGLPVLAVDIPSGLCADTGVVLGKAIKAERTLTFIGLKQGLFTGSGPEHCTDLHFDDLELPEEVFSALSSKVSQIEFKGFAPFFKPRARQSHKGDFGHVLVIGGDFGYGGAVQMSAEAALRVGAGLVSVATRQEHLPAILARRPELMVTGIEAAQDLDVMLRHASVLVLGPGLGQSNWSKELFQHALASGLPVVLDADGLNLLAKSERQDWASRKWIMTPHPGEMSRLLGLSTKQVEQDRFAAVRALHAKYTCSLMLKGAGSLVFRSDSSTIGVCSAGNPGMASGGMGDVLSGIVAGLVAQGFTLDNALAAGVCLHAEAADQVSQSGERGMLATDLFSTLRTMVNVGSKD